MEQPRCPKGFTMLKLLFTNLWIPAACLLHPQRGPGMQLGVQAVAGFFSGRCYTTFLWVTGCFKFSPSRTTTAVPHRRQTEQERLRGQTVSEILQEAIYHKNVLTEPAWLLSILLSSPWAPSLLNGISSWPDFSFHRWPVRFLAVCPVSVSPVTSNHVTESNFKVGTAFGLYFLSINFF